MSKLDELIRELCPNGVEYKPMSEVIQFLNGRAYKQTELLNNGKYKVVRVGNFYTNENWYYSDLELELDKYCERGDLLYTWAATLGPQIWNEDKAIFHYHIWKLKFDENLINKKFLYHFLSMDVDDIEKSLTKSTMPHVSMASMNKRMVPLPPLEIQREIVRMLDSYTESASELQKQLTAELTARKTQYSFYRERLLDKTKIKASAVEIRNLGKWSGGKTPSMAEKKYWDNGTIPWVSSKDVKQPILSDTIDHITDIAVSEAPMTLYPAGSVAIVTRSGILRHTFPVTYIPFETTVNQDIKILVTKEGVSSRYVSHALQAYGEDIRRKTKKQGGTVDSLDFQKVLDYQIPVPSLEIQNRIVEVLDNFEKICSDLNFGLPAEIEARQKQYEYYRDKLLTFVETGNTILNGTERNGTERNGTERNGTLIKLLRYVFGYVRIPLGDVGSICMCKRILKSQTNTVSGVPFYKIGTFGKEADAYISKETYDEYRSRYNFPKKGDVLISAAGTIGRTVVYDGKPAYFQDSNIVWIDNDESVVLNSYLRYCYELKPWKASEGGTIPRLYNDNIAKAVITVPSIEEQKRIVSILDRFDAICNDLTSGLPAEIEARQKQYEYYRDKLLNFRKYKDESSN